jgi:hypothetical protein
MDTTDDGEQEQTENWGKNYLFVIYSMTLSVCATIGMGLQPDWVMTLLERMWKKRSRLTFRYYLGFSSGGEGSWRKTWKFSVGIFGAPAEIRIGHLPNTHQSRYLLSQLALSLPEGIPCYGIHRLIWMAHSEAIIKLLAACVLHRTRGKRCPRCVVDFVFISSCLFGLPIVLSL